MATDRYDQRRAATYTLINTAIGWAGAYNRPTKAQLNTWTFQIEKTVFGLPAQGRSRALVWAAMGPDLHPEYFIHCQTMRLEAFVLKQQLAQQAKQQAQQMLDKTTHTITTRGKKNKTYICLACKQTAKPDSLLNWLQQGACPKIPTFTKSIFAPGHLFG